MKFELFRCMYILYDTVVARYPILTIEKQPRTPSELIAILQSVTVIRECIRGVFSLLFYPGNANNQKL